jgi:hypothetical protein
MNSPKSQETFINELITAFPEIKTQISDEDNLGLISLQIGCFRRFTQKAIDLNDLRTVKKCFDFAGVNVGDVTLPVENSLFISYLGKLNIIQGGEVEKLLSANLKDFRKTLQTYYESEPKDEKLKKFLDELKNDDYME